MAPAKCLKHRCASSPPKAHEAGYTAGALHGHAHVQCRLHHGRGAVAAGEQKPIQRRPEQTGGGPGPGGYRISLWPFTEQKTA